MQNNIYKFNNEIAQPIDGRSYVYDLHYHLVWVTKYREHAFDDEISQALKQEIITLANEKDCHIQAIEIMPNHVHLLISIKPKYAISSIVKVLKGTSARWLFKTYPQQMNKHFWHGHIWSPSYYVGSVGNTTEAIVKNYIKTQKEKPFK